MDKAEITFDEECMKRFIQDLLCLTDFVLWLADDGSTWKYVSSSAVVELTFKGNIHKVQKAIYEWLSIPPRKHNFELFGGQTK